MRISPVQDESAKSGTLVRAVAALFATALVAALSACSSGQGGEDVTIGSGQSQDPVTLDFPVFYVKRPVPDPAKTDIGDTDVRVVNKFEIGADLFMRDRASPSAPEINLTHEQTDDLGDIRDVDINFDGTKVVFSMRAKFIKGKDDDEQPTWNVWEYDTKAKALRRIIASDTVAEEGHDVMPHYLPDGRIVFTSTRQRTARAILLDEGKPQFGAQVEGSGNNPNPAFVLHVMDADGTNIHQISFNQSHDLYPNVLSSGQIVFTRWEHANGATAPINNGEGKMDLYKINPDGSDLQLLYGAQSHLTGTVDPTTGKPTIIHFLHPHAMQDGRMLALVRPFRSEDEGGDLVLIDTDNYVNNTEPVMASAGLAGPAQTRALPTDVRTTTGPSPGGRYRSASPLFDGTNRLLVSWSQCRLIENSLTVPCTADRLKDTTNPPVEAPPIYGIYIYDTRDSTQKPIVVPQEGFVYTEVVAGSPRQLPPVILDKVAGVDYPDNLLTENAGILHIRSVYDVDGVDLAPGGLRAVSNPTNPAYANRPARFLRVEKIVSQPDGDTKMVKNAFFGVAGRGRGMREILGYTPIEPDGSVLTKVPANVAIAISIVDANGQRIDSQQPGAYVAALSRRHTDWLQVMPGETKECNGCHNPNTDPAISHGRSALTDSINKGAAATGATFPGASPAFIAADAGETMAQVRGRKMCGGVCDLSVDIVYDDVWNPTYNPTVAEKMRPGSFDMCYAAGNSNVKDNPADPTHVHQCVNTLPAQAQSPAPPACSTKWTGQCRTVINYESNIETLWNLDRLTVVGGVSVNNKCSTCHTPKKDDGTARVPAGDLNLSNVADGITESDPDQLLSYGQLFDGRNGLKLDTTGALIEDCQVFAKDPITGLPTTTCAQFRPVAPPMSTCCAKRSSKFFDKFNKFDAANDTVDHRGFLNPSELKLLSEWLDVGAQYHNDPFYVPPPVN
jgi:hypothetical protein